MPTTHDTYLTDAQAVHENETAAAALLGLAAAEAQLLDHRGIYLTSDGGLVDITAQRRRLDEQRPVRKTGQWTISDPAHFLAYLGKHALPETELWANERAGTVTAVINAHLGTTGDGIEDYAGHQDHVITLRLPFTDDWKTWTENDGELHPQLTLAEFIEDHLPNFVKPTGADMLELAQTFQAKTKVDFESSQRIATGETELVFKETTAAAAGKTGRLAIPDTFTLALQVHEGGPLYKVEARFRYRITDGSLRLGYKLTRPGDVLRDAFGQVLDVIREADFDPWLMP